jgi:hypothetical protein
MQRGSAVVAIIALALAYASLSQGAGWNQNAHYALVRALTDGTAIVDPYRDQTADVSWFKGHYYAAKAPGLAFATLPLYFVLDTLGIKEAVAKTAPGSTDRTVGMHWVLGLVGSVLPATAIALLVRRLAEQLEPGVGLLAAVSAGLGTLLLPFATLFFAHVLAAALAFGAFAMLWTRRAPALAGLLAGLAVTVDYPLALAAVILGATPAAARRCTSSGSPPGFFPCSRTNGGLSAHRRTLRTRTPCSPAALPATTSSVRTTADSSESMDRTSWWESNCCSLHPASSE